MTTRAPGSVTVRPAEPRDLARVHAIEVASFPDPWSLSGFQDVLENPRARLEVAEAASGQLLGYAASWHLTDESEIANLAVSADARRQGIGATLLDRVLGTALATGVRSVFLEVRESNEAGRRLYESRGFAVVGRRPQYYGQPNEDALIMRRAL